MDLEEIASASHMRPPWGLTAGRLFAISYIIPLFYVAKIQIIPITTKG